jgi:hypothetical protein
MLGLLDDKLRNIVLFDVSLLASCRPGRIAKVGTKGDRAPNSCYRLRIPGNSSDSGKLELFRNNLSSSRRR